MRDVVSELLRPLDARDKARGERMAAAAKRRTGARIWRREWRRGAELAADVFMPGSRREDEAGASKRNRNEELQ